ncbi:MarR family transcriptional regulator [Tsukamurella sp. 8F]|uniref:MarR family winged helix-turn-helix transcriptional regulator n=1 Tax=unclassified Tsukamurella TaxID=2633480 RepID=UPI0023B8A47F|nr:MULTISPECIES: MarR family transcriptional regulator [unclassified Tsukamurella]MDF0532138.1 MarR family transcriptional regulator [Tsukamurella sp. 8J]MDF0585179.1 MarR family transcriptional regulator [Tsukamurella sp. 8F]
MEDLRETLVHLLREVALSFDAAMTDFGRRHRLGPRDVRALVLLLDAERAGTVATPGWLAPRLGVNSASCTALVDRLVAAGHVARTPLDTDRRKVALGVTADARALGESFFDPVLAPVRAAARGLSEQEARAVTDFLAACAPGSRRHDVAPPARSVRSGRTTPRRGNR